MIDKKISLVKVIKWLTDSYINLEKKSIPNAFKIAEIFEKHNTTFIKIELSGQYHVVELELKTIIEKNIFEYFSASDKKKLFSLWHDKEKVKLSDEYKCIDTDHNMIVLTNIQSGNRMTIPASIVSTNNALLEQMSSKDANKIGYLSCLEHQRKLQNCVENIKK